MRSWLLASSALLAFADYRQYRDGKCGSSHTLDFDNATLVRNNLGGQGPIATDPQEMLYRNLGTYRDPQGNEKEIGLRLKNATEYSAVNTDQNNGKTEGMGSVNVRLTTEVYLDFQFLAATDGDPDGWENLCVGQGGMTFYDVDSGGAKDVARRRVNNIGETEIISMCPPADAVYLSDDYDPPIPTGLDNSAFVAAQPDPNPPPCEAYHQKHTDLYNVLNPGQDGTWHGNLQTDQIAHTITYWWDNLCGFKVYFKADGTNDPANGRNFWFTGTAAQSITCTTTSTTSTSATTSTSSTTTSTSSTTTTTLHRACFDDQCDVCSGENRTCLQAILCTMGEILRPGDSTNPRPPPDGRQTCEIASAIVGKKCSACKECNACPPDDEVPAKYIELFEASEDALTRAEDVPSRDVERSIVTPATVLASAAAVAALTAAFAGLRWRALSRRQAADVVEDEELITESSE